MNTHIIGLHGPKRSGKTFIATHLYKMLVEQHHKTVALVGFGDALKEEMGKGLDISSSEIEANKDLYRPCLQWWGTDFRRNHCDKQYWVKKWLRKVHNMQAYLPGLIVIAHDIRFENEVECIVQEGGQVYRVEPVGSPYEHKDAHESERGLAIEMPEIFNYFQDFNKTKEQLEKLLEGL